MKTKKLLLLDMNGTIVESGSVIPEPTVDLISSLNYQIGIISGSTLSKMRRSLEPLLERKPNIYLLPEMGSSCFHGNYLTYDMNPQFDSGLRARVSLFAEMAFEDVGLDRDEETIITEGHSKITISLLGEEATLKQKKEADANGALRRKIIHNIHKYLERTGHRSMPTLTLAGYNSIDVMETNWDKRDGSRAFLSYLGLQPRDACFYGDNIKPGMNNWPLSYTGIISYEVAGLLDAFDKLRTA